MQSNIVLLAGGSGSRLWPLSNKQCPKQFLKLPSKNFSSFQLTIQRAIKLTNPSNIIITTNLAYKELVVKQLQEISLDKENFKYIFEKFSNNTGMSVYFACLYLLQNQNNNFTYFWPTDHIIENEGSFFRDILHELDVSKITLFGQKSSKLCSNFGYIVARQDQNLKVLNFYEKPETKIIEQINFDNFEIFKNLGIYIGLPSLFNSEFNSFYNNLPSVNFDSANQIIVAEIFDFLSVDKMIAENSLHLSVKEVKFFWKDIGSFNGIYELSGDLAFEYDVDIEEVKKFNEQNKEFELECNNGYTQITKKN